MLILEDSIASPRACASLSRLADETHGQTRSANKIERIGPSVFQSRHSNQYQADASRIEDRAHLLKTGHFEAIGFIR